MEDDIDIDVDLDLYELENVVEDVVEEPVKMKIKPKDKEHYVSNPVLYKHYVDWYAAIEDAKLAGKEEPPIHKFIVESIISIATRLSYKPNFIGYSYKDEMVADAIEICIRNIKTFNPEKTTNPFSYLTTISFNAFLRRIAIEKKQTLIKGKKIVELDISELVDIQYHDDETMHSHSQFLDYLRDNSYIVGLDSVKKKTTTLLAEDDTFVDLLTGE